MPGFNGTGPRGMGPMTGRGMGYCVVRLPEPRYMPPATCTDSDLKSRLSYLKEQARLMREQIEQIEKSIKTLEGNVTR